MVLREAMDRFFAGDDPVDYNLARLLELLNQFNASLDDQELYIGRFVEQQVETAEDLVTQSAREEGS